MITDESLEDLLSALERWQRARSEIDAIDRMDGYDKGYFFAREYAERDESRSAVKATLATVIAEAFS